MTINFKDALGVHADALELRAERTKVLAANIANESTPGYTARDVDFGAMLQDRIDTENGELSLSDDKPLSSMGADWFFIRPERPT